MSKGTMIEDVTDREISDMRYAPGERADRFRRAVGTCQPASGAQTARPTAQPGPSNSHATNQHAAHLKVLARPPSGD